MARSPFLSWSTWRDLFSGRLPGQVVIQFTTACNAACVQCGMRRTSREPRHTMDMDALKREIDAMAAQGIKAVSFTGGEPLLHLDAVAGLMRHAGAAGIPYVRTGTNGFLFSGAEKPGFEARVAKVADTLANTPMNAFWISLDSADPATHEANRGLPGVVEGIRRALPVFHERGIFPAANLGINRLTGGPGAIPGPPESELAFGDEAFIRAFQGAFRAFYSFAEELGFATVNACYPMSLDPAEAEAGAVYAATSEDDFIRFLPREKAAMLRALYTVIPEFRHRLRIFTPRSSVLGLMRQHLGLDQGAFPCRGGIDFFFLDAEDMHAYPCGYRGAEDLGPFSGLDVRSLDASAVCERCDWECFRDPSALAMPLLSALRNPLAFGAGLPQGCGYLSDWWEDLRYYKACGWFDCRRAPDRRAMARFAPGRAGKGGGAPLGAVQAR
jgi:hypothetical protein